MSRFLSLIYTLLCLQLVLLGCADNQSNDPKGEKQQTTNANQGSDDGKAAQEGTTTDSKVIQFSLDEDSHVDGTLGKIDKDKKYRFEVTVAPSNGQITNLDPASGKFTYTPNHNYNGKDYARIVARAGSKTTDLFVGFEIKAKNDAPYVDSEVYAVIGEDRFSGKFYFGDIDKDELSVETKTPPSKGVFEFLEVLGEFTYKPNPGATGIDKVTISVKDAATSSDAELSFHINADGRRALVQISPISPVDFSDTTVGAKTSQLFEVRNQGRISARVSSVTVEAPFAFTDSNTFPGAGGDCSQLLPPNSSCNISIDFAPSSHGLFLGTMQFGFHDGVDQQQITRELTGNGILPANVVAVYPAILQLGVVEADTIHYVELQVVNQGDSPASMVSGSIQGSYFKFRSPGNQFPGSTGSCGSVLQANESCTIALQMQSSARLINEQLSIGYSDGAADQQLQLAMSAEVVSQAVIATDRNVYDFNSTVPGSPVTLLATLTNSGDLAATGVSSGFTISSPAFSFTGGTYPGVNGTCTDSIAGNSSCVVEIQFDPPSPNGQNHQHRPTVDFHNGVNPDSFYNRPLLKGSVPLDGDISIVESGDFGNVIVGRTKKLTLTVKHRNELPITALTGEVTGGGFEFLGGSFPGDGGSCTSTLGNQEECTLALTLTASDAQEYSGVLRLSFNDFDDTGRTYELNLLGVGQRCKDLAFGNNGIVVIDTQRKSVDEEVKRIALSQPDNKLVVTYKNGSGRYAARFECEGTLDDAYGTNGRARLPSYTHVDDASITPENDVLIASNYYDMHSSIITNNGQGGGMLDSVIPNSDGLFGAEKTLVENSDTLWLAKQRTAANPALISRIDLATNTFIQFQPFTNVGHPHVAGMDVDDAGNLIIFGLISGAGSPQYWYDRFSPNGASLGRVPIIIPNQYVWSTVGFGHFSTLNQYFVVNRGEWAGAPESVAVIYPVTETLESFQMVHSGFGGSAQAYRVKEIQNDRIAIAVKRAPQNQWGVVTTGKPAGDGAPISFTELVWFPTEFELSDVVQTPDGGLFAYGRVNIGPDLYSLQLRLIER